jgi:predicted RNase H-like nuclease (RuvC/YqgF family)
MLDSQIIKLENENKVLKNEMNGMRKEILVLRKQLKNSEPGKDKRYRKFKENSH